MNGLFSRLYIWLGNRSNIGREIPPDSICAIDGCEGKAVEHWFPSVCALRSAGVQVEWLAVCAEHDIQVNEMTVRFFFADRYDDELQDYRTNRSEEDNAI